MSVMSPRVGLIAVDADGWPMLPQLADVVVSGATITAPVWSEWFPCVVGEHPAREYRHDQAGRLVVVAKLADATLPDGRPGALAIAWVPAATRDGENATYDLVINGPTMAPDVAAQWAVILNADGSFTVPDLDADTTAAGAIARDVWPPSWRLRLPTDNPGDPLGTPPISPDPPSGPRCLGAVLA
jgi:hypothetical protein